MISVAGMEGGSGDGTAASRKAGWVHAPPPARGSVAGPRVTTPRAAADLLQAVANAALDRLATGLPPATSAPRSSPPPYSTVPAPRSSADGRPLPPDGSAPPRRAAASRIPSAGSSDANAAAAGSTSDATGADTGPPQDAARPREFAADGRPLPPNGASAPARPISGRLPDEQPATAASKQGSGPIAPAGHNFVARPVSAPPGEFRFSVRCSCGRACDAPVTLAMLREATARGLPPAAAISLAQQAALNAMHRN